MSENHEPRFEDCPDAPVIFFSVPAAHGVENGIIEVELAARVLLPTPGTVDTRFRLFARLRCSVVAARLLQDCLGRALEMHERMQKAPAAAAVRFN
jgi:hypothetical protein